MTKNPKQRFRTGQVVALTRLEGHENPYKKILNGRFNLNASSRDISGKGHFVSVAEWEYTFVYDGLWEVESRIRPLHKHEIDGV